MGLEDGGGLHLKLIGSLGGLYLDNSVAEESYENFTQNSDSNVVIS